LQPWVRTPRGYQDAVTDQKRSPAMVFTGRSHAQALFGFLGERGGLSAPFTVCLVDRDVVGTSVGTGSTLESSKCLATSSTSQPKYLQRLSIAEDLDRTVDRGGVVDQVVVVHALREKQRVVGQVHRAEVAGGATHGAGAAARPTDCSRRG